MLSCISTIYEFLSHLQAVVDDITFLTHQPIKKHIRMVTNLIIYDVS